MGKVRSGRFQSARGNRYTTESLEPRRLLSNGFTIIASCPNGTDSDPNSIMMDSKGNIFALADSAIFEVAKGSSTVTPLASFDDTTPVAVVEDSAGNIFGATDGGFYFQPSTVFEISASSIAQGDPTLQTLATLNGDDGDAFDYTGSLAIDSHGTLFGTTNFPYSPQNGTVFEITAASIAQGDPTVTTLVTFDGTDGSQPVGGVTVDSAGDVFGTTANGGAYDRGTIFEVTASSIAAGSPTLTTLATFNGDNGGGPAAPLTIDSSGNLYGTAQDGQGNIFELPSGSSTIISLYQFTGGSDGQDPTTPVVVDTSGNIYGSSPWQGSNPGGLGNYGYVFELPKGATSLNMLFDPGLQSEGPWCNSNVVIDSQGTLYGGAFAGGAYNLGCVYELPKAVTSQVGFVQQPTATTVGALFSPVVSVAVEDQYGNVETGDGSDVTISLGSGPAGSTLYGTLTVPAVDGIATFPNLWLNQGGVDTLEASDASLTTGISSSFPVTGSYGLNIPSPFDGTDGATPTGRVAIDSAGDLFGVAYGGLYSDGTVFEIAHGTDVISTVDSFNGTDGVSQNNLGTLIFDSNCDLFGTTSYGGTYGDGSVFEIAAGTTTVTTIASFNGTNGANPEGQMSVDSSGNLYGITATGGTHGYGTIFEIV
ncbi:MAG: choice-of-anchor tandem repeat GloVer-containing protein, partial [Tepidisphaeraceae bacterium]